MDGFVLQVHRVERFGSSENVDLWSTFPFKSSKMELPVLFLQLTSRDNSVFNRKSNDLLPDLNMDKDSYNGTYFMIWGSFKDMWRSLVI